MHLSFTRLRFTAAALLTLTVAVLVLGLLDAPGTPRVVLVVLFGLTAPGWALTAFLLPLRPSIEWTLATTLSIVVSVVLSVTLLMLPAWHPAAAMTVLAGLTALALAVHLLRSTPHPDGLERAPRPPAGGFS